MPTRSAQWRISPHASTCAAAGSWSLRDPATAATRYPRDRLKVAGRFDHYICRRDDGLRGRAEAEVPTMIAEVLRAQGVADAAIDVIPDEQEAIAAALAMGRPGTCCWCLPMH